MQFDAYKYGSAAVAGQLDSTQAVTEVAVNVRFLGVGDASQTSLGHAAIAVDIAADPDADGCTTSRTQLLVDCGPGVLNAFVEHYQCLPDAVFITHCHLDHIADFEKLFIKSWFHSPQRHCAKLFVPAAIIPLLHERVGTYPGALAEGGVNFWEAFQLIPVSSGFEFAGLQFSVKPARHHGENSAFSLYLADAFYYTGDTRPIPEILEYDIDTQAVIFHDCSIIGNPSHAGVDDLLAQYSQPVLQRTYVYHYNHPDQKSVFEQQGLQCIEVGDEFSFTVSAT